MKYSESKSLTLVGHRKKQNLQLALTQKPIPLPVFIGPELQGTCGVERRRSWVFIVGHRAAAGWVWPLGPVLPLGAGLPLSRAPLPVASLPGADWLSRFLFFPVHIPE